MKISIVTYSVNVIINTKIEKMLEIWSLQIIRKGIVPVTTPLNVFGWSIINSNSDSEHRVHFFMPRELAEFT
jgi:hypothetical protein